MTPPDFTAPVDAEQEALLKDLGGPLWEAGECPSLCPNAIPKARAMIAAYTDAVLERCAGLVDAEPEMPGPMPEKLRARLFVLGVRVDCTAEAEDALRMLVRATKTSIAAAVRALKGGA